MFQVRVWEAAYGSSYDEAVRNVTPIGGRLALTGRSAVLRVQTGNPPTAPQSLPSAGFTGFFLRLYEEWAGGVLHVWGQPSGITAEYDQPAQLEVQVGGVPPFEYQWRVNGTNIPGATNLRHFIAHCRPEHGGNYDVVVSNGDGTATSSSAALQVLPYGAPSIRIGDQLAAGTLFEASPATVTITGGFTNGLIFYNLDGTTPGFGSTYYTGPFVLTNSATVGAMSVSEDLSQSAVAPSVTVLVVSNILRTSVIGNGTVVASPARGPYASNSVVTLVAYPDRGHALSQWVGDLTGTVNPVSLTISRPRSVQAVFMRSSYPLTLSTLGGGTVMAGGQNIAPNTYYPTGTVVSLGAVEASGWSFLRWEGTVSAADNPLLLTMNQSNDLRAVFGTVVNTVVAGSGTILLNQTNPIPYGHSVTATALPAPGFSFLAWSGVASGMDNPAVFAVTNATPTIGAVFNGPPVPVILTQPTNLTVLLGNSAMFTVTAGGATPLNYQWRKGTKPIVGATNSTYTIVSAVPADAGDYDVVVSNAYWYVTSTAAALRVVIPLSISLQPMSQAVASGGVATLSVVANGTEPVSYQWQSQAGPIPGATNATYVLDPVTVNHAGNYTVVVTNPYGAVTSSVATVTVFIPAAITTQPLNQAVPAGGTATFQVSATGYPAPNYQWWFLDQALPGANGSSLVITNVGTNDLGAYQVVVWNTFSSATSSPAQLVMSPSLRSPFMGATVIWGKTATLSVSAVGSSPLSYQWFKDGVPVASGTNQTLEFPAVQLNDGGMYSVVVSSPWGSVTNPPAQLVVNPANIALGLYAGVIIDGMPGYTYGIQYTTDLRDTNSWVTATNLTLSQPVELWVDQSVNIHSTSNAKRYYRVVGQ